MNRLRSSATIVVAVLTASIVLATVAAGASAASGAPLAPAASANPLYWSATKAKGAILFENPQVIRDVEIEIVAATCAGLGLAKTVKTQRRYRSFRCPLVYRTSDGGPRARVTIYLRTRTARTWCWNDTGVEQLIASRACRRR